jgi:hypothetical protein
MRVGLIPGSVLLLSPELALVLELFARLYSFLSKMLVE